MKTKKKKKKLKNYIKQIKKIYEKPLIVLIMIEFAVVFYYIRFSTLLPLVKVLKFSIVINSTRQHFNQIECCQTFFLVIQFSTLPVGLIRVLSIKKFQLLPRSCSGN